MTSQSQVITKSESDVSVIHVWDRQKGETGLAYRLFSVYRDAGFNRNIREVAKDLGRGYSTVKNLSIENQWMQRAFAYDEHQNKETERELRYEIIDARKRHHKLGAMMLDFAQESIENLRSMGDLLSVRDVVQLVEAGHKIESTALGMSNEITESRVIGDINVQQKEAIPVEILERIGKEIASAKSAGEDTESIEAEFEELTKPVLLLDDNGNSENMVVSVEV
jgi:hypothetical protein